MEVATRFHSEPFTILIAGKFIGRDTLNMDIKLILVGLSVVFSIACIFFGTQNGFYDSDDYHGNGSAH
ncbi:hypothetical protein B9T07_06880 [Limnospira fusiformis CCALA 023]|nr:hypothetical protein AP285_13865 [Arthrospira platensis YZ]BDT13280.1 hypothetical protein N39L_30030 [Arthrospira platensis NIES-39]